MWSGAEKKAGSGGKPLLSSQCRKYGVCSAAVRKLEDTSLGRIIITKNSANHKCLRKPFLPCDQLAGYAESTSPRFRDRCARPIPSMKRRGLGTRL